MQSVGVVVATYNGERFIREQLLSICCQTRKPDCIVITDGGSSDNTLRICENIRNECNDIQWVIVQSNERLTVANNFEKGINLINSDIVFLCDQDDYWYENKIEEFLKVFESDDECIVVISDADVVDSDLNKKGGTQWQSICFKPSKKMIAGEELLSEMLQRNIFTGMCMAYKNKAFEYETIKSNYMLHDETIGWLAVFKGKVGFITKPLAAYRQHENNSIGSNKYTVYQSGEKAKIKVKQSTEKTLKKLSELREQYRGYGQLNDSISEAVSFYKDRMKLYESKKIEGIISCLDYKFKGRYKKFCSQTERAFLKDLYCIVF